MFDHPKHRPAHRPCQVFDNAVNAAVVQMAARVDHPVVNLAARQSVQSLAWAQVYPHRLFQWSNQPVTTSATVDKIPSEKTIHRTQTHWRFCFRRRSISFISWALYSITPMACVGGSAGSCHRVLRINDNRQCGEAGLEKWVPTTPGSTKCCVPT